MAIDTTRTFKPIRIALLTVSDTRGPEDDTSGDILAQRIRDAGHALAERAIEKDDADRIAVRLNNWIDDTTIDAVVDRGRTRRGVEGSAARACPVGITGSVKAPRLSARRPSCSDQGRSGARVSRSVSEPRSALGEVAAR